ncbi:MAG: glycosyltransferase family 2 protein [Candidatus Magasanikiibacteriota bacterium]
MKLSIITVSYNSAETIEDTIKSVMAQNYSDLEYIIIDGGSKDNTLEVVEKYKDKIAKIISEPDKGIYDAMNKGIKMATGGVVGIINSDDFYFNEHIFNDVMNEFEKTGSEAVYGDIVYVDREETKKQVRFWQAGEYREEKLNCGWIMPHPAFFVKKEIYNKFGLFNLDFRIAADYELMLRFLKNGLKVSYLPQTFVCMREGGFSGQSFRQRKKGWQELKKAWAINNFKIPRFFITRRILSKIKQYFI